MRPLVFVGLILSSCYRTPSPQTPVTREVFDAGGGNPSRVSKQAMRHWFLEHRRFASHIAGECQAIKDHMLDWSDMTEGKVCAAAREVEIQTIGRDHKALP
jgi:hypothetical protein